MSITQATLERRIANGVKSHKKYYDPELQAYARLFVPFEKLRSKTNNPHHASPSPSKGSDDAFLTSLLHWFKHTFFKWTNKPACQTCNASGEFMTFITVDGPITSEEVEGQASRVECYHCTKCSGTTRFPRFNNPRTLLTKREGRCGEWANAFTLILISCGFETRYIEDFTDHVWCEVWSNAQDKWLMADSCENKLDAPGMYENGWGKKLSYIFGYGKDEVVDVTKRYTREFHMADFQSRRSSGKLENWLELYVKQMSSMAMAGGKSDRNRSVELYRRECNDVSYFAKIQNTTWEQSKDISEGRISGDTSWKIARSEAGIIKTSSAANAKVNDESSTTTSLDYHTNISPYVTSLNHHLHPLHIEITPNPTSSYLPNYHTSHVHNSKCITINEIPISLGYQGLNVVVIDEGSYAVLQVRCFKVFDEIEDGSVSSITALEQFITSIPDNRIVIGATVNYSDSSLISDSLSNLLKTHLNIEIEASSSSSSLGFITTLHKPSSHLQPSFHTYQTSSFSIILPPLPNATEFELLEIRNVTSLTPSGRVNDSIMPLSKQLTCTLSEAKEAGALALSQSQSESESGDCYLGFTVMRNMPILMLTKGGLPLVGGVGCRTFLSLPCHLVSAPPPPPAAAMVKVKDDVSQSKSKSVSPLCSMFGPSLLRSAGGNLEDTDKVLRNKRLVGVYMSAGWCNPCLQFTPLLSSFYNSHTTISPNDIEIIFVSSDRDSSSFTNYFSTMPWCALPSFSDRLTHKKLSDLFEVKGIPCLVIIDVKTGEVVSKNGRSEVIEFKGDSETVVAIWRSLLGDDSLADDDDDDDDAYDDIQGGELNEAYFTRPLKLTLSPEEKKIKFEQTVRTLFAQYVRDGLTPNAAALEAMKQLRAKGISIESESEVIVTPPSSNILVDFKRYRSVILIVGGGINKSNSEVEVKVKASSDLNDGVRKDDNVTSITAYINKDCLISGISAGGLIHGDTSTNVVEVDLEVDLTKVTFELDGSNGECVSCFEGLFSDDSGLINLTIMTSKGRRFEFNPDNQSDGERFELNIVKLDSMFIGFITSSTVINSKGIVDNYSHFLTFGVIVKDGQLTHKHLPLKTRESEITDTITNTFLKTSTKQLLKTCLDRLLIYIKNAKNNYTTSKYRTIKVNNTIFDRDIGSLPFSFHFLIDVIGFDCYFKTCDGGKREFVVCIPLVCDLEGMKGRVLKVMDRIEEDWQDFF